MDIIRLMNFMIAIAFAVCYSYQFFYIAVPFIVRRRRKLGPVPLHRFAVLIAARNEEAVITELIASIRAQDYPAELVEIFVVADNCTDGTADAARRAGATVWERFDAEHVGKGYALDFLFTRIGESYTPDCFDAFMVFDADNLLDESYITEMNRTFSSGARIITSCRNSKNYGDNWISAGYSLWFLRESQYVNRSRYALGTSCAISGTGFLISREVVERNGGWHFFLLTEDIEFTVHSVIDCEKIAYCERAVLYDEQPVRFSQSCRQRMRWAKGYLQVFRRYGGKLFAGLFSKRGFACYDMIMTILPAIVLTAVSIALNLAVLINSLAIGDGIAVVLSSAGELVLNAYLMLAAIGAITTFAEWRAIHCHPVKKLLYIFTFPIFMFTYIPISFAAMFRRVEWAPIIHTEVKNLTDVRNAG